MPEHNLTAVVTLSAYTTVDPGATANTKSAWITLTQRTVSDTNSIFLIYDALTRTSGNADIDMYLDVGCGDACSEQVVAPNIPLYCWNSSAEAILPPACTPILPIKIPAGVRVAVRLMSSSTVAADRTIGVTLYGLRQAAT